MAFRRKYFFFDIDGTLVPKAGGTEIPAGTKAAMEELRRQGHFLAIATGRSQFLASGLCRELGFEYMVSDGGNGIVLEGKLIGIEPLPRHLCLELAAQCEARGFSWAVSPENSDIRLTKDSRFADRAGSYYMKTVVKPDLEIESFPEILKMFVACAPGEEEQIPALQILPWIRYQPEYIFVEPTDKSVGVRRVMDYYQAPYEDAVVFGDGRNDLTMFVPEWTCIAMGNAVEELKQRADFVTKNADDGGIEYALRHFGWI